MGKAAVATTGPHLSLTPPIETSQGTLSLSNPGKHGNALFNSHGDVNNHTWLLDSGATDNMTFDAGDFSHTSPPQRTRIANANGVMSSVTGAGTVMLSPTLPLPNTLLVPSLSHKLLYVSQITSNLNCVVIFYPKFCLLQDILTKEIIGRGTEKGGLYYMDDFSMGRAHLTHHSSGINE